MEGGGVCERTDEVDILLGRLHLRRAWLWVSSIVQ